MAIDLSRPPRMADFDASLRLGKPEYRAERKRLQLELLRLQVRLRDELTCSAAVVFEGVDAAGKGGAITRLTGHLDPRGFRVHPIGPPAGVERREHYLQRFHALMPRRGQLAIFDRSWYGRVLVERVEGLTPRADWDRAYREICDFERLYTESGFALVKLWLYVSKDEQLRRFEARGADPFKRYKLTEDDWRNRERWDDYLEAADEMFQRTHSEAAPWVLISAEQKRHARIAVLRAVLERLQRGMG